MTIRKINEKNQREIDAICAANPSDVIIRLEAEKAALTAQRDRMLAALKNVVGPSTDYVSSMAQARAIIAESEALITEKK